MLEKLLAIIFSKSITQALKQLFQKPKKSATAFLLGGLFGVSFSFVLLVATVLIISRWLFRG